VEILTGIGKWMDVNGESIYGTTHTPLAPQTFGHVTRKGNKLYLHVTRWPKDGKITLAGLETPIKNVSLLADSKKDKLDVAQSGTDDWNIQGPVNAPDPVNSVFVVETDGVPKGNLDAPIRLASNIPEQRLHVFDSSSLGGKLRFGQGNPAENGIMGWNKNELATGRVKWVVRVDEPIEVELDLIYVAVKGKHGGSYALKVADQLFSGTVETQPMPDSHKKVKYIPHTLGTLKLDAGIHTIELRGTEITDKELFMPSSIILRTP
jgi:hypothetical protein